MIEINNIQKSHGFYSITELDQDGNIIKEHGICKNIITNEGEKYLAEFFSQPMETVFNMSTLNSTTEDIDNNRFHHVYSCRGAHNYSTHNYSSTIRFGDGYGVVSKDDISLFHEVTDIPVIYQYDVFTGAYDKTNPSDSYSPNHAILRNYIKSGITSEVEELLNNTYPEGYIAKSNALSQNILIQSEPTMITEIGLFYGDHMLTHSVLPEAITFDSNTRSVLINYILTWVFPLKPYVCDCKIADSVRNKTDFDNIPAEYEAYVQHICIASTQIPREYEYARNFENRENYVWINDNYYSPNSLEVMNPSVTLRLPLFTNRTDLIDFNKFTLDHRKLRELVGVKADTTLTYENYYSGKNYLKEIGNNLKGSFPMLPASEAEEYFRPIKEYTHEELKALLTEPMYYNAFLNALTRIPKYGNRQDLYNLTTFDEIKAFVEQEMGDLTEDPIYCDDFYVVCNYAFFDYSNRPWLIPNMKYLVQEQLNVHMRLSCIPTDTISDTKNVIFTSYLNISSPYQKTWTKDNSYIDTQGNLLGFLTNTLQCRFVSLINGFDSKFFTLVIIRNKNTLKPFKVDGFTGLTDFDDYIINFGETFHEVECCKDTEDNIFMQRNAFDMLDIDNCYSKVLAYYTVGYSFIHYYATFVYGKESQYDTKVITNPDQVKIFENMFNKALSIDFTGMTDEELVKELFKSDILFKNYYMFYSLDLPSPTGSFLDILNLVKQYVPIIKADPLLECVHTLFEQYAVKWEELLGTDMSRVMPEVNRQLQASKDLIAKYKLTTNDYPDLPNLYRVLPLDKNDGVANNCIFNTNYMYGYPYVFESDTSLSSSPYYLFGIYNETLDVSAKYKENKVAPYFVLAKY